VVQFLTGTVVVIGTSTGLAGIDGANGNLLWTVTLSGGIDRASPLAEDSIIYAVTPNGVAAAVDALTGVVFWTNATLGTGTDTAPVLGNSKLYILQTQGFDVHVL